MITLSHFVNLKLWNFFITITKYWLDLLDFLFAQFDFVQCCLFVLIDRKLFLESQLILIVFHYKMRVHLYKICLCHLCIFEYFTCVWHQVCIIINALALYRCNRLCHFAGHLKFVLRFLAFVVVCILLTRMWLNFIILDGECIQHLTFWIRILECLLCQFGWHYLIQCLLISHSFLFGILNYLCIVILLRDLFFGIHLPLTILLNIFTWSVEPFLHF